MIPSLMNIGCYPLKHLLVAFVVEWKARTVGTAHLPGSIIVSDHCLQQDALELIQRMLPVVFFLFVDKNPSSCPSLNMLWEIKTY